MRRKNDYADRLKSEKTGPALLCFEPTRCSLASFPKLPRQTDSFPIPPVSNH